jgi:decaprenylphospho-beta-D-ribofuranose 2-oxidase
VHGKNQARDGTFIRHVDSIRLFHPSHGFVELSPTENADVFRATCGGYGTTGIIVSARLRSSPLPASSIELQSIKIGSISEAAAQLKHAAKNSDFVYSWHDFLGAGRDFGRGFVLAGRFLPSQQPSTPRNSPRASNFSAVWRAKLPFSLLNPWTCKFANAIYWAKLNRRRSSSTSFERSLFPIYGAENYFRAFGRTGFHEYQAVIPHDRFDDYIAGLRAAMKRRKVIVTLASAKLFVGVPDLVRFTGDGICFAVNICRGSAAGEFLQDLDRLVVEVAGRPNIIKDSRLPRSVLEACYPEVSRFRSIVRDWDPARLFRSELSQRLGL